MTKNLLRIFLVLLILVLQITVLFSQAPTTQGTEFYCSFMRNGYRVCNGVTTNDKLSVIASAPRATTVTVSNPNTGWSQNFSVSANGVNSILISGEQCYSNNSEVIENKGLVITATDTISLFIGNESTNSFDASNVLPINALSDRYITQNITPMTMNSISNCYDINKSVFVIIATEDNTIIDITPKCETLGGRIAGQTFNITLNRGQTYQVQSQTGGTSGDFSGTVIQARDCKKIAVFNGIVSTGIPSTMSNGFDHIFEQAVSTDYWGKRFAITSSMSRNLDYVKITALQNGTTIKKDGVLVSTIQSGNSYEFTLTSSPGACYIETSGPCAVNLYQTTGAYDNSNGDPSMVWISPVEQQINDITFSTFQAQNINNHYVNIVTKTENVTSLRLNNNPITTPFSTFSADPTLSYAKVSIAAGAHHLTSTTGFTAHVYGFGDAQGYAYTVGSSAVALNKDIALDSIPSSQLFGNYGLCMNESMHFSVITDFEYESVTWHFGDGTIHHGDNVYHAYSEAGTYEILACIKFNYVNCLGSVYDTLRLSMPVWPTYNIVDTLHLCQSGFPHTHHGVYIEGPGHYFIDEITASGCDSIVNLLVVSHPESEYYIYLPELIYPDLGEDFGFCNGLTAELDPHYPEGYAGSVLWNTGSTASPLIITEEGTYSVTLTNDYGGIVCSTTDEIEVSFLSEVTISSIVVNEREACSPLNIQLDNVTIPNSDEHNMTYKWYILDTAGNYLYYTKLRNPEFTIVEPGEYTVILIVITENGCSDTLIRENFLKVHAIPQFPELGPDFGFCNETTVILAPLETDTSSTVTYWWNTGSRNDTIEIFESGTYILTVTDNITGKDCSLTDTIHVEIFRKPRVRYDVNRQEDCQPLKVRFTDRSTPLAEEKTYRWYISSSTTGEQLFYSEEKNPEFILEEADQYTVLLYIETENGCMDTLEERKFLTVYIQPKVEFTPLYERSLHENGGTEVRFLNHTDSSYMMLPYLSWLWDFGDETFEEAEFSPTHLYSSWGDYTVTFSVTADFGCTDQVSHIIRIEADLEFPNIITPNGDGFNDVFAVKNLNINIDPNDPDQYRSNVLHIYNRWGKLVYEAENYNTFVDENGVIQQNDIFFDGKDLPDGIYYYTFYYKNYMKEFTYHGSLTITR